MIFFRPVSSNNTQTHIMLTTVFLSISQLPCSDVKAEYRNQCCGSSPQSPLTFDTLSTCSKNGSTTRFHLGCAAAKPFLTSPSVCPCPVTGPSDVCEQVQTYPTCIIGSGPGGYGAMLAYEREGRLDDMIVIERGLDADYFTKSNPSFPSLQISAAYGPWTPASTTAPWDATYPATNGYVTWSAESNVFGGQFMYNGGAYMVGPTSLKNVPELVKDGIEMCTASIMPRDVCNNTCGVITIGNDVITSNSSYNGMSIESVPLISNGTYNPNNPSARFSLYADALARGVQFKTGRAVHSIEKQTSGMDLVDDEDSVYVLKDSIGSAIMKCDSIVLAAGNVQTATIIQNSPTLLQACPKAGQGVTNDIGVMISATFDGAYGLESPISVFSADATAHTYTSCSVSGGTTLCYVIAYGGITPDELVDDEDNVVNGKLVHDFGNLVNTSFIQSAEDTLAVTLNTLENSFGKNGTYMFITPLGGFEGKRDEDTNIPAQIDFNTTFGPMLTKEDIINNEIQLRFVERTVIGIYHDAGSMRHCINPGTGRFKNEDIWVGDNSANVDGYAGSPVPMACGLGHLAGTSALNRHQS